jgi:hypothetical protein
LQASHPLRASSGSLRKRDTSRRQGRWGRRTNALGPSGPRPVPGTIRFDAKNFALGAVVSSILVSLLGYVPLAVLTAVIPPDPLGRGRTVHGLPLAILGCLLAIFLDAGFTARRARRRAGDPMFEGFGAGFVGGFLFAIPADGCAFLVVIGHPYPGGLADWEAAGYHPVEGDSVGAGADRRWPGGHSPQGRELQGGCPHCDNGWSGYGWPPAPGVVPVLSVQQDLPIPSQLPSPYR